MNNVTTLEGGPFTSFLTPGNWVKAKASKSPTSHCLVADGPESLWGKPSAHPVPLVVCGAVGTSCPFHPVTVHWPLNIYLSQVSSESPFCSSWHLSPTSGRAKFSFRLSVSRKRPVQATQAKGQRGRLKNASGLGLSSQPEHFLSVLFLCCRSPVFFLRMSVLFLYDWFRAGLRGFKSQPCQLPVTWPWTRQLTFLCFNFLIFRMGMMIVLTLGQAGNS